MQKIRNTKAFTLIELLVVVAIIAILMAILVPALGRARAVAKDTVCASNVRQISLGLISYASAFNNLLPPCAESTAATTTWHIRLWDFVMNRPYDPNQIVPPYAYLTKTVFECPSASITSKLGYGGYVTTDHRSNGYALNVSTPGTLPTILFPSNADVDEAARMRESKRLLGVDQPAGTLMLTDAQGFSAEYYDRGASLNQMDVLSANSTAGRMLDAVGRHGTARDSWNMAFYDGSVRLVPFTKVPGTPSQYYLISSKMVPSVLLSAPDVSADTKRFWLGKSP